SSLPLRAKNPASARASMERNASINSALRASSATLGEPNTSRCEDEEALRSAAMAGSVGRQAPLAPPRTTRTLPRLEVSPGTVRAKSGDPKHDHHDPEAKAQGAADANALLGCGHPIHVIPQPPWRDGEPHADNDPKVSPDDQQQPP